MPSTTPVILGGFYPPGVNPPTNGVAFGIAAAVHWSDALFIGVGNDCDNANGNWSTHLLRSVYSVPPGTSKHYAWYVLPGSWQNAIDFMATAN